MMISCPEMMVSCHEMMISCHEMTIIDGCPPKTSHDIGSFSHNLLTNFRAHTSTKAKNMRTAISNRAGMPVAANTMVSSNRE